VDAWNQQRAGIQVLECDILFQGRNGRRKCLGKLNEASEGKSGKRRAADRGGKTKGEEQGKRGREWSSPPL